MCLRVSPRFRLRSSETVDSAIPVSAASRRLADAPGFDQMREHLRAVHGPSRVMHILVLLDELAEDRDVIELLGLERLALATSRQPGHCGRCGWSAPEMVCACERIAGQGKRREGRGQE